MRLLRLLIDPGVEWQDNDDDDDRRSSRFTNRFILFFKYIFLAEATAEASCGVNYGNKTKHHVVKNRDCLWRSGRAASRYQSSSSCAAAVEIVCR
jgi:hypothetical protein